MSQEKKTVFVCRKCKHPIEVDKSLLRIDCALLRNGERSLDALLLPEQPSPSQGVAIPPSGVVVPSGTGSAGPSSLFDSSFRAQSSVQRHSPSVRHSEIITEGRSLTMTKSQSTSRFTSSGRHKNRETMREPGSGSMSGSLSSQDAVFQLLGKSQGGAQLPLMNAPETGQHDKASHLKAPSSSSNIRTVRRTKRLNRQTVAVQQVPPSAPNEGLPSFVMATSHGITFSASHSLVTGPSGLNQSVVPPVAGSVSRHPLQQGTSPSAASLGTNSSSGSSSSESGLKSPIASTSPQSEAFLQQQLIAQEEKKREAALADLFALVADLTLVDQPLCAHCAGKCLESMQQELELLQEEAQKYEDFDRELERSIMDSDKQQMLEKETRELKEREEMLREELRKTAQKKARVQQERMIAEQRLKTLQDLELKYWEQFNYHQRKLLQQEEELEMMTMARSYKQARLKRLCKVNILNDAFYISHDGHFGTINGFRLGRMTSIPVSWEENNAALGFVSLLVCTISKLVDFKSKNYRILPRGSTSRIKRLEPGSSSGTVMDLCGDTGRFLWGRRFDNALMWLLDYVSELNDHCQHIDPSFKPPHDINADTIGGLSIRMSKEEYQWTRALKFLLTDIKMLVAWVSTRPRR